MRNPGKYVRRALAQLAALGTLSCGMTFAAEWKAVNTGLTNLEIRSLAVDPANSTTVYAGTHNGLFKSLDGGATWRPSGLPDRATTHLVIDFVNPSILYAATEFTSTGYWCYERILFKSTDGGATWSDSVTPSEQGCDTIRVLLLDPTDANTLVYAAYTLTDYGFNFLKSTDGGATWKRLPPRYPSPRTFGTTSQR